MYKSVHQVSELNEAHDGKAVPAQYSTYLYHNYSAIVRLDCCEDKFLAEDITERSYGVMTSEPESPHL